MLPINLILIPPKAPMKMRSSPYPLSTMEHFLHLRNLSPYVRFLDLELTKISIFNENCVMPKIWLKS
jgi:hypothetical protein